MSLTYADTLFPLVSACRENRSHRQTMAETPSLFDLKQLQQLGFPFAQQSHYFLSEEKHGSR